MPKPAIRSSKYVCWCDDCGGRNWRLKGEYAAHIGRSSPPKYYACQWKSPDGGVCEKVFTSCQNLKARQSSVHGAENERQFSCYFCERSFESAVRRTVHFRAKHQEYLWQCVDYSCGYRGARERDTLVTHILKRHFGRGVRVSVEAVNSFVVPPRIPYVPPSTVEPPNFHLDTPATGPSSSAAIDSDSFFPSQRLESMESLLPPDSSAGHALSSTLAGGSSCSPLWFLAGDQEATVPPGASSSILPSHCIYRGNEADSKPLYAAPPSFMEPPNPPGTVADLERLEFEIAHPSSNCPVGVTSPAPYGLAGHEVIGPLVGHACASWIPRPGILPMGDQHRFAGVGIDGASYHPQQEPLAPRYPLASRPASVSATWMHPAESRAAEPAMILRCPAYMETSLVAPLAPPGDANIPRQWSSDHTSRRLAESPQEGWWSSDPLGAASNDEVFSSLCNVDTNQSSGYFI